MVTVAQRWETFRRTLVVFDELDVKTQRLLRAAWYAGGAAMYEAVLDAAEGPEDAGVDRMEEIHQELLAYVSDMANATTHRLVPGGRA
jgi:hypothetical protein